jgi:hypothetical protein
MWVSIIYAAHYIILKVHSLLLELAAKAFCKYSYCCLEGDKGGVSLGRKQGNVQVRYKVLTASIIKMTVFWYPAPHRLGEVDSVTNCSKTLYSMREGTNCATVEHIYSTWRSLLSQFFPAQPLKTISYMCLCVCVYIYIYIYTLCMKA